MKEGDAGRRVILHLTEILWVPDAFRSAYIQQSAATSTDKLNVRRLNDFKGSSLPLLRFLYSAVSDGGTGSRTCAFMPRIFQVAVTITASTSERMAGVFCLSLELPTEWSQWTHARDEAQLPSGCFNPPPGCRDASAAAVKVIVYNYDRLKGFWTTLPRNKTNSESSIYNNLRMLLLKCHQCFCSHLNFLTVDANTLRMLITESLSRRLKEFK